MNPDFNFDTKQHLAVVLVLLFSLTGAYILFDSQELNTRENIDWKQVELEDVRSGETYTVAELEKPVLIETFAVWCTTCTKQQKETQEFHSKSEVTSVSLNVDPEEDRENIQEHLNRHGFDWRYSISPTSLTRSLISDHGRVMVNPPSAPMVLVCKDGERKLPTGVKPVSKLHEEVEKGC
ncbi:MAG: hypothetical protein BRC29_02995 [Nanohaloarchaea archaeon SW_7_43_1]|nr:MAG: hypothetical protein BRC29_02995 [Nanohaloarchaea archaeon SW_7_43_1]